MKLLKSALVAMLMCASMPTVCQPREKPRAFTISGPTLIAFFPVTPADKRGDTDALEDFGFYLGKLEQPLKERGIRLETSYTRYFTVIEGACRIVVPAHGQPGYYMIVPGRAPHIEQGVNTDDEVLKAADAYFRTPVRTH